MGIKTIQKSVVENDQGQPVTVKLTAFTNRNIQYRVTVASVLVFTSSDLKSAVVAYSDAVEQASNRSDNDKQS